MLKTLKYKLMIIIAAVTMSAPMILPAAVSADVCSSTIGMNISSGVESATNESPNCLGGSSVTSSVESLAKKVVELFSVVVGIISVIMIIYAGFRYITSGGESGSVSNAKNTLIYAIIGLVIVVLAQLIVHFVLNTANGVGTTSTL